MCISPTGGSARAGVSPTRYQASRTPEARSPNAEARRIRGRSANNLQRGMNLDEEVRKKVLLGQ
jgi:hypothetical protein